ncbi:MAG TPA: hypothetical protein VJ787_03435 [Thermoleophilia bacterium]|nr:hypothetical protein [Thermoleophilia bacterium]
MHEPTALRRVVRGLSAGRSGVVTPTRFAGETVLRFCFVNPLTTPADVDLVLSRFD